MTENLFESASAEMLTEINREAESLLTGQLQASVAADQRALTFSGLLAAAVAGMAGAIASLHGDVTLPVVALATALAVAAMLALLSARPTPWSFAGGWPDLWEPDVIAARPLHEALAEQAKNYRRSTLVNDARMKGAATLMRWSMGVTGAALLLAIVWAWVAVLS